MSRGLGTIQRQLLVALFCADQTKGGWTKLAQTPGSTAGGDWYAVARLRLLEIEHDAEIGHTVHQRSRPEDRAFKRSRRAPVRRALRTLTNRGLAEEQLIAVDLVDLGQRNWRPSGEKPATRPVLYARITELGKEWITHHARERLDEYSVRMVKASSDHDPDARERRMARMAERAWWHEQASKSSESPGQRKAPAGVDDDSQIVVRTEALNKDELVQLLIGEGFDRDQVLTVLRRWHRELQGFLRREFGDPGPPLDEYSFGSAEIEELRTRLS
ncbi:hypothetical protein ACWEP5_36390 [Nocardia niigatensis]